MLVHVLLLLNKCNREAESLSDSRNDLAVKCMCMSLLKSFGFIQY
jgi:hypothetical protein